MFPEEMQDVFRDVELEVMSQINARFGWEPGQHSGDQTPDDDRLEDVLPFVRVGRAGGAPIRGAEHTDRPVVDIDVMALTRAESRLMAVQIEQLLLARRRPFDNVNVLMSPQRVPWVEGSRIVRFYASYQISLRR